MHKLILKTSVFFFDKFVCDNLIDEKKNWLNNKQNFKNYSRVIVNSIIQFVKILESHDNAINWKHEMKIFANIKFWLLLIEIKCKKRKIENNKNFITNRVECFHSLISYRIYYRLTMHENNNVTKIIVLIKMTKKENDEHERWKTIFVKKMNWISQCENHILMSSNILCNVWKCFYILKIKIVAKQNNI